MIYQSLFSKRKVLACYGRKVINTTRHTKALLDERLLYTRIQNFPPIFGSIPNLLCSLWSVRNDMDGKWVHGKKQDRKDKLKRTYVTAIFARIGSQIVSMQERKKYQTIFSHICNLFANLEYTNQGRGFWSWLQACKIIIGPSAHRPSLARCRFVGAATCSP
jgi:hypothetical protein